MPCDAAGSIGACTAHSLTDAHCGAHRRGPTLGAFNPQFTERSARARAVAACARTRHARARTRTHADVDARTQVREGMRASEAAALCASRAPGRLAHRRCPRVRHSVQRSLYHAADDARRAIAYALQRADGAGHVIQQTTERHCGYPTNGQQAATLNSQECGMAYKVAHVALHMQHTAHSAQNSDDLLRYYVRNGVMTTPLFGYDTTLPPSAGLYRLLSILVERADCIYLSNRPSRARCEACLRRQCYPPPLACTRTSTHPCANAHMNARARSAPLHEQTHAAAHAHARTHTRSLGTAGAR